MTTVKQTDNRQRSAAAIPRLDSMARCAKLPRSDKGKYGVLDGLASKAVVIIGAGSHLKR
jgi:hypothetical protein